MVKLTERQLVAVFQIHQYMYYDEEKDWKECGKPKKHIFNDIKALTPLANHYSKRQQRVNGDGFRKALIKGGVNLGNTSPKDVEAENKEEV